MTAGGLTGAEEGVSLSASIALECEACSRSLRRSAYEVGGVRHTQARCLWCALRHTPLVRRSVAVTVVVGTLLVAINQGNIILSGAALASPGLEGAVYVRGALLPGDVRS